MRKLSLKAKIAATIAVQVTLSLSVLAFFIYVPMQSALRKMMHSEFTFIASSKTEQLHDVLGTIDAALQTMAANEVVRTTTDKDGSASRYLRDMQLATHAHIAHLMLVDGNGAIVAAGDRALIGKRLPDVWRGTEVSGKYQINADAVPDMLPFADKATLAVSRVVENGSGSPLAIVAYLNWADITQRLLSGMRDVSSNTEQGVMVLLNGRGHVLGTSRLLDNDKSSSSHVAQTLQSLGLQVANTSEFNASAADLDVSLGEQVFHGHQAVLDRDLNWSLLAARNVGIFDVDLRAIRLNMLGLAAFIVVICLVTGYRLAVSVSNALLTLLPSFEKLATGNLDCLMEIETVDEVAHIGRQFNEFVARLRSIVTNIIESTQTLSDSSRLLADLSQNLVSNAQETSSQASSASQISDEVSTNINTVSAGVEEMSLSINEIARSSDEAARVATSAVRIAEMTNTTVQELGGSSSEIGNVIKVINSIAEQTNLLALNATIEAARAGEAGKGFAVVANEVKELAKETARATEDIGKKIEAIQAKTKGAVSAIGEIGSIINQVNDYQTTIASAVQEQLATTTEIGRNIAEVAERSYMITKNITAVAQFAQSASTGANDTQEASSAVSRISADLHRLVEAFRYSR